jgi:hypothetical protein
MCTIIVVFIYDRGRASGPILMCNTCATILEFFSLFVDTPLLQNSPPVLYCKFLMYCLPGYTFRAQQTGSLNVAVIGCKQKAEQA